jgi:hypothetical protein
MEQGDPDLEAVLVQRLHQLGEEGLPEEDFWGTFIQCFRCKWVVLKSRFPHNHTCTKRRRLGRNGSSTLRSLDDSDVIDLTDDSIDVGESEGPTSADDGAATAYSARASFRVVGLAV